MIQLLSSLIEWLALLTLSSIGFDMEPVSCGAASPTEYRTVATVYTPGSDTLGWSPEAATDCAEAAVRALPVNDTPRYIEPVAHSYDS